MAKIIISRDRAVIREVELDKDRMTLGRKPDNDIVLPHPAMSGNHAAFTLIMDDVFLEDLGSTNGTYVNGSRVAKMMLEDHDVVVVAKFKLEFIGGPRRPSPSSEETATVPMLGSIEVRSGPNKGKTLALVKPLSTLGQPGLQVVAITRVGNAYYFNHVDGQVPLVNGVASGKAPRRLLDGDAIDLVGSALVFSLSPAPGSAL